MKTVAAQVLVLLEVKEWLNNHINNQQQPRKTAQGEPSGLVCAIGMRIMITQRVSGIG